MIVKSPRASRSSKEFLLASAPKELLMQTFTFGHYLPWAKLKQGDKNYADFHPFERFHGVTIENQDVRRVLPSYTID